MDTSAANFPTRKVLIIAPHASAKFGGESILPIHYFKRLPGVNVIPYMVVHERTKAELIELLGSDIANVTFIKDTSFHRLLHRCSKKLPHRIGGFTFGLVLDLFTQIEQRRISKKLIEKESIDLIHEPIRVSPKVPSMQFSMGVPVVIGPMNGGMRFPEPFQYMQGRFEKHFTKIGRVVSQLLNRLIPGKRFATTLLAANERTMLALPRTKAKVEHFVENGVDLSIFSQEIGKPEKSASQQYRFVYLGRLVDWKCVDTLIFAAKKLSDQGYCFEIEIIGDGYLRSELQQLTNELNVSHIVKFCGFLTQRECLSLIHISEPTRPY